MIFALELFGIIAGTFVLLLVYSAAAISSKWSRYEEQVEVSEKIRRKDGLN